MSVFGGKKAGASATLADRRTETRVSVNRAAVLVAPTLEMACVIVDLSTGGMKLRLDRGAALPSSIVVVDVAAAVAYDATLVWQRGQEAGLKQTGAQSLRGLVSGRLTAARAAWMRAGGR